MAITAPVCAPIQLPIDVIELGLEAMDRVHDEDGSEIAGHNSDWHCPGFHFLHLDACEPFEISEKVHELFLAIDLQGDEGGVRFAEPPPQAAIRRFATRSARHLPVQGRRRAWVDWP